MDVKGLEQLVKGPVQDTLTRNQKPGYENELVSSLL